MILAALAAAALVWWMWRRGEFRSLTLRDAAAASGVLIGLIILVKGEIVAGGLLIGIGVAWFARHRFRTQPSMPRDEAAKLLGVSADADADTIRAAHRRLAARVHPDQGGSAELAARVNAARDILLSRAD